MANSVQVSSTGQVVVTEVDAQVIEVTSPTAPLTVEIQTSGPQGHQGPAGVTTLSALSDVDATGTANRSLLIYDATQQKWVSSAQTTVDEVLNGGNF